MHEPAMETEDYGFQGTKRSVRTRDQKSRSMYITNMITLGQVVYVNDQAVGPSDDRGMGNPALRDLTAPLAGLGKRLGLRPGSDRDRNNKSRANRVIGC